MRHYQALQKKLGGKDAGQWHWTVQRGNDDILPAGACADGQCVHNSKEEAEDHETDRIIGLVKRADQKPIKLIPCYATVCGEPAVYEVFVDGLSVLSCSHHLMQPDRKYFKREEIWKS